MINFRWRPKTGADVGEANLQGQNDLLRSQLGDCQSRVAAALRRANDLRDQLAAAQSDYAELVASKTPLSAERRTFLQQENAQLRRNLRDMEDRARRAEAHDPTVRLGG